MTLHKLRDLLLTLGLPVYHYHAHQQPDSYIVWAEYGGHKLNADGQTQERAHRVQVDFFTKTEFHPAAEQIEALLDGDEIAFEPHVDYEPDTGYIHHIWDCEVA